MKNERTVTGMSEYIERKALRDALYDAEAITMSGVKILNQFPSADVAPVRHGKWIDAREYCGDYMCSNCDALYGTNRFNFCPNCGAVMEDSNA